MAFTDNFNRANGGLGANWTTDSSFTALAIASNACVGSTGSVHNVSVYTAGGTISADQYAQCKVTNINDYLGLVLRSDGAGTFYVCFYPPVVTAVTIYKVVAGSFTSLVTGTGITPAINDVLYFEAVGSALTLKVNGVTKASITDSSITGAGYAGIDIFNNTGAAVDDFEMGSLGAVTVTVNLTGVSASPAVGVLGFNVSFPLGSVAAAPQIGTGTVVLTADVSVALTGVAADPQIGVGTVVIEGAVVEPPPVTPAGGHFGVMLRQPEDKFVYLKGVAANPRVGRGTIGQDIARLTEAYSVPIARAATRKPAKMPPGMRRLFKPVEKPIPPAVFVYQVGLSKLKSGVGTGKVNAHYEEIDEEVIAMIDLL